MGPDVVRVKGWERFGWLRHGFSTRGGGCSHAYGPGELNLGFTPEDERECVVRNREAFLRATGGLPVHAELPALATVRQVHSGAVVERCGGTEEPVDADGMATAVAGMMLGILTADCVPVLLADTRQRVVGAVHAGWRGTAAGIAGQAVRLMVERFGCAPRDMVAAVGPSIGPCCYAVGEEVRARFAEDLFAGATLDLWEANRRQLVLAGVEDVTVLGECTACARDADGGKRYFSHRAEAGRTGRMMAAIGIVE